MKLMMAQSVPPRLAPHRQRVGGGSGGSGGSLVAALRQQWLDGWKSCYVELLCVCDLFTLICESWSTVPRGPPRLTYL
jgi:hypothetical protein